MAKRRTKKDSSAEIAALIFALLNHPDTPTEILDGIRDGLCDMENMAQVLTKISEQSEYLEELVGRFVR